jgi:hypothetical protein
VATPPSAIELLDRADRNLEHLFTLLALLLPEDAVRIAFRALHTDDHQLKGTVFSISKARRRRPRVNSRCRCSMQTPKSGVTDGRALEELLATTAESTGV